jgi:AbrB family looped-hinge helix DNA binding protein
MSNPSSSITDRGQTTIPKDIRAVLKLHKGDKLLWTIKNGEVFLSVKRTSGRPNVPPPPPVKPYA